MPELIDSDFKFSIDDVAATQEGFDEDLLLSVDSTGEPRFALATVHISDILDGAGRPMPMTDKMIEDGNDVEYIEALVQAVKDEGNDCFPPLVVIERDGHYEWIDGQHRMTALDRAGVKTSQAYILMGDR